MRHHGHARTLTLVGLALGLVFGSATTVPGETPKAFARVPKFAIAASPIELAGDVRPRQYVGVVGRQAAWIGSETGEAEIWVHPIKVASGFRLDFQIPEYVEPVQGTDVARHVEVRPEVTTITYSHATFTVRQHVLAPLDEPGLLVLLDVETVRPLDIVVSFQQVFQMAWPGAFGGQYARWEPTLKAFLFSESQRRRNAYLGSPWATTASNHPAHALPDAPSVFRIAVDAERARREFIPIAIVGGNEPRETLVEKYAGLIARAESLYRARVDHAAKLRETGVSMTSPDARLDLALEWAKVNLDEQQVCHPELGCGPVAGWGPSGRGTRPGFGWFFGGDAAINSHAMSATGLHEDVAAMLRFFARYQRDDGKIAHEISQAAATIPWFTEFPYAYYHADTTPHWIVALWQHWRATNDTALVDELWPAVTRAWAWCLTTETDGDGIIENTTGGFGAIEVGDIGQNIHQDIYLAAVWLQAAAAMEELSTTRGDATRAAEARRVHDAGRRTLNERYWLEGEGHHAFGILASGDVNDALTVWPATAAAFGLFDAPRGARTLAAIASHRLTADWGTRMLARDHRLYEPLHYNMGAVWPFVTGFVAWGHYQYGRPWSGYPLIDAMARMAFDFARGRHAELLSGAFYRPLDQAVPHQFFATSMLVSPIVRGLVGWDPDAPRGHATLEPQLPPSWPAFEIVRLPAGSARVSARFTREHGRATATLWSEGGSVTLHYRPDVPPGARDVRSTVDGGDTSGHVEGAMATRTSGLVQVRLAAGAAPMTVTTIWRSGLAIVPPLVDLVVGQASAGLRVLDVSDEDGALRIDVEAQAGTTHVLDVRGERPTSLEGARLVDWQDDGGRVAIDFPAAGGEFTRMTVRARLP